MSGVKEQVVGTYVARLAESGIAVLAFDHRGFGESDGRRQHEDAAGEDFSRVSVASLRRAAATVRSHG